MSVDAEMWLRAAHAANDGEAVTWFTNIHRPQKPTPKECTTKHRRLDNLALRWAHRLSFFDKLAVQHAHRACETYRSAQVIETALQHLRELRAVYAKTLIAKQDYHLLVKNLLKEHIETQRLKTHTQKCVRSADSGTTKQNTTPYVSMLTQKRHSSHMKGSRDCAQTQLCSSHATHDKPDTPSYNRKISYNWRRKPQKPTD